MSAETPGTKPRMPPMRTVVMRERMMEPSRNLSMYLDDSILGILATRFCLDCFGIIAMFVDIPL